MEKINFLTSDGVRVVGNWFPVEGATKAVLLLHMRPATKESWTDFALKLNESGFSALAIDLRGHGQSTEQNGAKIDYNNFPEGSHAECRLDVDASMEWLKERGIGAFYIVGGSIGANLAIDAMARHSEIKKGAALSPGLEYLGVSAEDAIKKIKGALLLVASKDDGYSYDSALKLQKLNPAAATKLYDDAGHATDMFKKELNLTDEIVKWLLK